jgi:hypothetical protein
LKLRFAIKGTKKGKIENPTTERDRSMPNASFDWASLLAYSLIKRQQNMGFYGSQLCIMN